MTLEKKGGGANPPQKKGHEDEEKRSKLQEPENPGGSKSTELPIP